MEFDGQTNQQFIHPPRGAELIIRFGPHMTTLKKLRETKARKNLPNDEANRVEYTRNSMVFFRISMF